jgi:glycosyltransferase involved in cell wall biosynthesis
MRIVHLVSSLQVGGMEHFVLRLAAEQRRLGHDAGVLAFSGGPLLDQALASETPVRVLRGAGKLGRVLDAVRFFGAHRPAVLHPHNPSSLHFGVVGKLASRARLVLTYHGRGLRDAREPAPREWRQTDAVVSVSEGALAQVPATAPQDRVRVIRNGVIPVSASRSRAEMRRELELAERPTGIIVARVDGMKGHETVLRALLRLRDHGTPVTVLVAGDGAERVRLEAMASAAGLAPDWIRFLGFRSDVPNLLAAADFFLLPSVTEGLPLSLLEAMSMGLPAIATPVGGIPEVIRPGKDGLLAPVNDDVALAAAMSRFCTEPDLLRVLGRQAQARAIQDFSFERMTREYLSLYEQLLAPR